MNIRSQLRKNTIYKPAVWKYVEVLSFLQTSLFPFYGFKIAIL